VTEPLATAGRRPAQASVQLHVALQESLAAPPNYVLIGTADAAAAATI
jgi:hypothetical protein